MAVSIRKQRSLVLCTAISLVSINPKGPHDHPSRDPCALASGWFSQLLALEVSIIGRTPPACTKNSYRKIAGNIDPRPFLIEAIDPVRFSALHEGPRQLQALLPLAGATSA